MNSTPQNYLFDLFKVQLGPHIRRIHGYLGLTALAVLCKELVPPERLVFAGGPGTNSPADTERPLQYKLFVTGLMFYQQLVDSALGSAFSIWLKFSLCWQGSWDSCAMQSQEQGKFSEGTDGRARNDHTNLSVLKLNHKPKLFTISCILVGLPCQLDDKESSYNAGALGLIPGLERSPGEGNGYSLQYSCLENSVDRGASRPTVGYRQALLCVFSTFFSPFHLDIVYQLSHLLISSILICY